MSECIISIKPMLFIGDNYYPSGGWEDFKGYFETVDHAKEHVLKKDEGQWCHIVENSKIKWTATRKYMLNLKYTDWEWEEVNDE